MLRNRSVMSGTVVHPADLDASLQLSLAPWVRKSMTRETRLPFAVRSAFLEGGKGHLRAVSEKCMPAR